MIDSGLATVLDNVVWNSLHGPQALHARWSSDRRAVRFDPDVSVFAAVDEFDAGSWSALREVAGGQYTVLIAPGLPALPEGVRLTFSSRVVQMVDTARERAIRPASSGDWRVEPLGAGDLPAMFELIELTSPGPFRNRTPELGTYIGVRHGGRVIAMAGERMHPDGAVEVSAVCTHPDHQRTGLAARLSALVADGIKERGLVPFLHVVDDNWPARRLYERLGFEHRAELTVFGIRFV